MFDVCVMCCVVAVVNLVNYTYQCTNRINVPIVKTAMIYTDVLSCGKFQIIDLYIVYGYETKNTFKIVNACGCVVCCCFFSYFLSQATVSVKIRHFLICICSFYLSCVLLEKSIL